MRTRPLLLLGPLPAAQKARPPSIPTGSLGPLFPDSSSSWPESLGEIFCGCVCFLECAF